MAGHEVVRMLIEDPPGSLDGYEVAADPEDLVLIDFMDRPTGTADGVMGPGQLNY